VTAANHVNVVTRLGTRKSYTRHLSNKFDPTPCGTRPDPLGHPGEYTASAR